MTLFDQLIARQRPASFAHEDALCVAFMDINPVANGHVLVVPRQSAQTLAELPDATRKHLWDVAHRIGQAQQRALGSHGQHLLINDGRAASQTVPHVHIHVVPRHHGDAVRAITGLVWHVLTLWIPRSENPARRQRLDAQAAKIRAAFTAAPPMA